MKPLKILVKDVESFMLSERIMYASGDNKRFLITLHAAPNHKRYIIQNMLTKHETCFTKKGPAVKFFNELKADNN